MVIFIEKFDEVHVKEYLEKATSLTGRAGHWGSAAQLVLRLDLLKQLNKLIWLAGMVFEE